MLLLSLIIEICKLHSAPASWVSCDWCGIVPKLFILEPVNSWLGNIGASSSPKDLMVRALDESNWANYTNHVWISVNSLYICVSCHYHLFASCVIMKGFNGHAFPRSWETQNKATKCHASCMSTTLASVSKVSHENNWRVPLCRMTRRGTALDGLVHLEWAARNLRLEFRQWNMVILLHYCICIDTYIYM